MQDGKIISTYDAAYFAYCVSASLAHNGPALGAGEARIAEVVKRGCF